MDNRRRYKVIETLGKGGFGTVYRAEMLGQGGFAKQVALKLLNDSDDNDMEEVTLRFRDEARILGLIDHRAVVKVDSLTQLEQGWAVVMEYVHGVNVSALVKAPCPPRCALSVTEEVASALNAAFAMPNNMTGQPLGLIHRDIKPANIRVTPQGTVKVLDFGVARATFDKREALTTAMRFGSLRYMAPERMDDVETHAGDIFALGLVVAELLGGRRYPEPPKGEKRYEPFLNGVLQFVRTNLTSGPYPIEDPVLLERTVQLVAACLAFDHEQRPNAKELEREARALSKSVGGPYLRDWCEGEVPRLMKLVESEPVNTDSILIESTGVHNITGLGENSQTISTRTASKLMFGFAGGGILLVVVALAMLLGVWWTWPMTPVVVDVEPVAEPVEPELVEPEPVVEPELVEPEPVEPEPVEPEPVVEPVPDVVKHAPVAPKPPPKPKGARVRRAGDAKAVILKGKGGTHTLSGNRKTVPAGTYSVHATFADGTSMVAGSVELSKGEAATVNCQSMLMICKKR